MKADRIKEYFDGLLKEEAVVPVLGYSVSVFDRKELLLSLQGGARRLTPEGPLPVTANTRYRIASISKMFTTLALMQLWEQGKLDLDTEAGEYLGFPFRNPNYPDQPVTVRMLLAHTSSLRDGSFYIIPCHESVRELVLPGGKYYESSRWAAPGDAADPSPGHTYTYCNLAFGLLGTMVERVSGERFDCYERDHVLAPMGIRGGFNVGLLSPEVFAELAPLHRRMLNGQRDIRGPWTEMWDFYPNGQPDPDTIYRGGATPGSMVADSLKGYVPGTNATEFSPQGGLRISTDELSLFGRMFLNGGIAPNGNRIISEKAVEEISRPVHLYDPAHPSGAAEDNGRSYGSGFNIISPVIGSDRVHPTKDITLIGHTGSINGLFSACYMDPEAGIGFAYAFVGTGRDPDTVPSRFSTRNGFQEATLECLCENLL